MAIDPPDHQMPCYLGDGAYVRISELGVELYTTDGRQVTNRVVLGDEELIRLLQYLERQKLITWSLQR